MSARLERARLLIASHRFADAKREAGMALAEDPDDAWAHAIMAICLVQSEKYTAATEHAEQAVGLAPDEPHMHFILSGLWLARNFPDKAEHEVRAAIELNPLDADYHHRLGVIHAERKHWQEALQAVDEALRHDPEHTPSLNLRAMCLRSLGKKDEARAQLGEALASDPDNPHTHANVGWNLLAAGKHKEALKHFQEALRLDPELDWARAGVVETLKAHNPVYRPILKFFLWVGNLSTGNQWKFLLGGYVGYLVASNVARNVPALRIVMVPLIVAYLAIVFVSWFANPLANSLLRLHPVGRLALARKDRIASNWVGGSLLLAVASLVLWATVGWPGYGEIALFFGLLAIPLAMTTALEDRPRTMMWIYTAVVAASGAFFTWVGCLTDTQIEGLANAIGLDRLRSIHDVLANVFILGSLLSVWAANILSSMRWRRH